MTRRIANHHWNHPDGELWPALETDDHVALVDGHGLRFSGRVDALSTDHSCLWIRLDGGMGRQLFHHQDGFTLEDPAGPPAAA